MRQPLISVICPVYNGGEYIRHLIDFFIAALPIEKELIIVDGGSTDGTIQTIESFLKHHPEITLLHNPRKYVPFALNMAIATSKGRYIARVDAHTEYPENYLENCLSVSQQTGAENVGGYIQSEGKSPKGKGIAFAMSSRFGVGDSGFRTQRIDSAVETVPFGFWPREVFEKYGLFDEDLIRNQDDEFNYRTISKGGTVFQSSFIHSRYYVRDSFSDLFRQYFQYGLFKPLVIRKIGKIVRLRHIIPSLFVIYIFTLPISFFFPVWLIPLSLYLLMGFLFSVKSSHPFYTILAYFILHVSYGLGFLKGLFTAAPSSQFRI